MANVLDIIVRAQDMATSVIEGVGEAASSTASMIEENWAKIGAASAVAGAAMEGFARQQAPLTETASRVAAAMGTNSERIRELALESANVTRPLGQVLNTMEIGRQQGIRSEEQLMNFVAAWDTVGDATGENAEELARAGAVLAAFDIDDPTEAFAALGFMQQETTTSSAEFLRSIQRIAPDMQDMGLSIDQSAAVMGVLEREMGLTGRVARQEFMQAVQSADGSMETMLDTLGISTEQFDEYQQMVADSSGVIERNADIHAESYTPIQKLQHAVSELAFKYGDLAKFAGALALPLIALGPAIKGLSLAKQGLTLVTGGLSKAMAFLAANPIVLIIVAIAALVAGFIWLWNNVEGFRNFFLAAWEHIQNAAVWAWENFIKPTFESIKVGIDFLIAAAKVYMRIWKAVFDGVGAAVKWVWNNVIQPVFGWIKERWRLAVEGVKIIWETVLKPTWDNVKVGVDLLKQKIDDFKAGWTTVWEGIKNAVRGPANGIIGFLNGIINGVERMVNGVASAINKIPSFTIPDWVPGIGGRSYSLPHVGSISLGRIPSLASGGIVRATPGGVMALIGEGGRNERVSPIGGPDDPMVEMVKVMKDILRKLDDRMRLSVDGRDLAAALGGPLVAEIRARTGQ